MTSVGCFLASSSFLIAPPCCTLALDCIAVKHVQGLATASASRFRLTKAQTVFAWRAAKRRQKVIANLRPFGNLDRSCTERQPLKLVGARPVTSPMQVEQLLCRKYGGQRHEQNSARLPRSISFPLAGPLIRGSELQMSPHEALEVELVFRQLRARALENSSGLLGGLLTRMSSTGSMIPAPKEMSPDAVWRTPRGEERVFRRGQPLADESRGGLLPAANRGYSAAEKISAAMGGGRRRDAFTSPPTAVIHDHFPIVFACLAGPPAQKKRGQKL